MIMLTTYGNPDKDLLLICSGHVGADLEYSNKWFVAH